jgi:hypothetical protein
VEVPQPERLQRKDDRPDPDRDAGEEEMEPDRDGELDPGKLFGVHALT